MKRYPPTFRRLGIALGLTVAIIFLISTAPHNPQLSLSWFSLPKLTSVEPISDAASEQYIVSAIENCYQTQNPDTCYAKSASAFADSFEPAFVLKTIANNEKRPRLFQVCHETLHFFGREVYDRARDASKALAQGDATCFAGYYHGVLEGYFIENRLFPGRGNDALIAKKIVPLCQTDPTKTQKERDECLHGLGHALMFATDTELPRALALCDVFPRAEATWCYSGVFMENSTSSTNKNHPSKYLRKDDPAYPCPILDDKYLSMCYTLQTQYVVAQSNGNWEKAFAFCQEVPPAYRKDCSMAVGGSLAGYSQDPRVIKDNCERPLDRGDRGACVMGAVGSMGERYNNPFDHVIPLCSLLNTEKSACYQQMTNLMSNWTKDASALAAACQKIPEPSYREICEERLRLNPKFQ